MATGLDFLGTGWSFPPTFDNQSGAVVMVSEQTDVAQSLEILLSTRPGERIMHPRFGCNLDVLVFEPITTSLIAFVKEMIRTAILYYEPRISVDSINISTAEIHDGLVLIELNYTVLATNSRYNLVYPFYLEEGSINDFALGDAPKPLSLTA
jgi:uncharacterized protein